MIRICALALVAACSSRPRVATCDDDLTGTWRGEAGTWMILDDHTTLEAYPVFDDMPDHATAVIHAPARAVVAPRLIDLRRLPHGLVGEVHRRYMQGAVACESKAQIHVLACSDAALEIVLADPAPPVTFAPCAWAGPPPSHRELWTR